MATRFRFHTFRSHRKVGVAMQCIRNGGKGVGHVPDVHLEHQKGVKQLWKFLWWAWYLIAVCSQEELCWVSAIRRPPHQPPGDGQSLSASDGNPLGCRCVTWAISGHAQLTDAHPWPEHQGNVSQSCSVSHSNPLEQSHLAKRERK